jgi:ADP-ribose pyrophosphatase YjhB (NUDIX family)
VVREVAEETGLAVAVAALHDVVADVTALDGVGVALHHDRVIYELAVTGGAVRDEQAGTTDRAAWFGPAELAGVPLMPMTAELLGQPVTPLPPARAAIGVEPGQPALDAEPAAIGQRFGAYAVATDPAGRMLLALIADGYPGGGQWHLPGGGTDHGEQPRAALLRELAEETDQVGRILRLMDVSSRHNPTEAWRGRIWDWHVVRAIYRVAVYVPTPPRVTEAAGGSTAAARWIFPAEAADLPLTDPAQEGLRELCERSDD